MMKNILAALALSVAAPVAAAETPAAETAATSATLITAKVNGMVCDFCAQAVTVMFNKDDAVEAVEVDLDNGEIRVTLKDGAAMADQRVEELVTKSGYDLVEIQRANA
ncbi:MAG: heavy-metal-associated domain-containing protein [Pseudomonadota bacterium]